MRAKRRWIVLRLIVALVTAVPPVMVRTAVAGDTESTIYVVSHGWHTGIVISQADIPGHLWPEKGDFADRTYLEVGWGDEAFYRAPDVTLAMALRAALQSKASALHVVGFDEAVADYFPASDIVAVRISVKGIADLVDFIQSSLRRPDGGRTEPLGRGLYGKSWFYPAKGRYSLFYNCNHWIAEGLREAGVAIDVATAMTAGNVIAQASRVGERVR